jgi:hypothetical protein
VVLYIGIGLLCSIAYHIWLRRENAARDRGERDELIDGGVGEANSVALDARPNGRFATVENARREKGDEWSGYRYII